MPAGGVRIFRIIEDGEADDLAVDRTRVVAPGRKLAPAIRLADLAVGVLEFAFAFLLSKRVVDSNAESALLCIAERDRHGTRGEGNVENKEATSAEVMKGNDSCFVQDLLAIGSEPFILRDETGAAPTSAVLFTIRP